LYVQIRETLRSEYEGLPPKTAVPTEQELLERFGVSRITIRKALDDLVRDGLIERRAARGTFVSVPKLTHELNSITSWTEQLCAMGYRPSTLSRSCEEIAPPPPVAYALSLQPEEPVVMLRRVRLSGDEKLTLMTNYIPSRLVPGIAIEWPAVESLYELLESRYRLVPVRAVDTVEAKSATEDQAEALRIAPWSPVLVMTRVSYQQDDAPFELAIAVSRGDRYQYRVELHGRVRAAETKGGV